MLKFMNNEIEATIKFDNVAQVRAVGCTLAPTE